MSSNSRKIRRMCLQKSTYDSIRPAKLKKIRTAKLFMTTYEFTQNEPSFKHSSHDLHSNRALVIFTLTSSQSLNALFPSYISWIIASRVINHGANRINNNFTHSVNDKIRRRLLIIFRPISTLLIERSGFFSIEFRNDLLKTTGS
jgi:hypothetical protein